MSPDWLVWIGAMWCLMILSYLYKDNPFYKFAEYTVIGGSAGHFILMGMVSAWKVGIVPIVTKAAYVNFIPIIGGLLLFARYTKWPWLSRYSISLLAGAGIGLALRSSVDAQFIGQIIATIKPVTADYTGINNLLIMVGVVSVIAYFIFTREQKGLWGYITKLGRLTMMMSFGAGYVVTILQTMALGVRNFYFLIVEWLLA